MDGIPIREKADNFDTNPKIVVCIPAYNEENSIEMLVKEALKHANEVIVCDDGSSDDTSATARKAGAIVVNHSKNLGYGNTIRTLFQKALERNADIIVAVLYNKIHFNKHDIVINNYNNYWSYIADYRQYFIYYCCHVVKRN